MSTISCDDPQGFDLHHGPSFIGDDYATNDISHSERYGSEPTFVLRSDAPEELLILWGSAMPEEIPDEEAEQLGMNPKAERAVVVYRSEEQVTAVRPYAGGAELVSLYPKLGYGVYTTHTHWQTSGRVNANFYFGECRFSE